MNYRTAQAQLKIAVASNDKAAIESLYNQIDDKFHKLLHADETGTVSPATMQKWEDLHGQVCTEVMRVRKSN